MLLKVCHNDKLEMLPSFSSICYDVYTCGDTERIHDTERMQKLRTAAITRRKGETQEGNSQITEDKMSVAELLKRSENSNELLWKNY